MDASFFNSRWRGLPRATKRRDLMKHAAIWVFYAVGALAVAYLALYAYVAFTGRAFEPGDPIHIFRKPNAPSYSVTPSGTFAA